MTKSDTPEWVAALADVAVVEQGTRRGALQVLAEIARDPAAPTNDRIKAASAILIGTTPAVKTITDIEAARFKSAGGQPPRRPMISMTPTELRNHAGVVYDVE